MNKTTRMPKIPTIKHKPIDRHKFDNYELFIGRRTQTQMGQERSAKKPTRVTPHNNHKDPLASLYITEKVIIGNERDRLSTLPTEGKSDYNTIQTEPTEISTKYLQQIERSHLKTDADFHTINNATQLQRKTKAVNTKKDSVKDFISKTREMMLMKYTTNIKKERAIRLKETYENEIESINDTIESMEQAKTLFNDNFFVKFGDYVKHLAVQRDHEKTKAAQLLEEIMRYKNEILQIQNKIKKQEMDKSNAIRWFYFQVQVKESKQMHLTQNDLQRMREKYRNGLVFETPGEFIDELKKFEMKNITKINEFNDLSLQLDELNKEKAMLINEDIKSNKLILDQLAIKEKELEQILKRNNQLRTEIKGIENSDANEDPQQRNNYQYGTHRGNTTIIGLVRERLPLKSKKISHAKLYGKILTLHKTTQDVQFKREHEIKKLNTNEITMVNMLEHIEHVIDFLIGKFNYYQMNPTQYGKSLRNVIYGIEKDHKMEKCKKLKEEVERKFEMLQEKIEDRNNKIYYIPRKKVDTFSEYARKKKTKTDDGRNKVHEPEFADFMHDMDDQSVKSDEN